MSIFKPHHSKNSSVDPDAEYTIEDDRSAWEKFTGKYRVLLSAIKCFIGLKNETTSAHVLHTLKDISSTPKTNHKKDSAGLVTYEPIINDYHAALTNPKHEFANNANDAKSISFTAKKPN